MHEYSGGICLAVGVIISLFSFAWGAQRGNFSEKNKLLLIIGVVLSAVGFFLLLVNADHFFVG